MEKDFKRSSFFNVLVIGDNHKEIISKYDNNLKVKPYIKYKYKDREKLHKNAIKVLKGVIDNADKVNLDEFTLSALKAKYEQLVGTKPFDYYVSLTQGLFYDENGNATSDTNPNGKFDSAKVGKNFAVPFKLLDGSESYSAKVSDIDWGKMHLNEDVVKTYNAAWELVVDGREPQTEDETTIANAMGDKQMYFSKFASKEEYVRYSCAFWQYAVVDENGWYSMDDTSNEEWVNNFYDTYIKPLPEETTLTIYECSVR